MQRKARDNYGTEFEGLFHSNLKITRRTCDEKCQLKSNLHDRLLVFQGIITKHNEYVTIHFKHQMGGKLVLNANVFGILVLIYVVQ